MKITKPIQPPDNWWVGILVKCKCFSTLEFEVADRLVTKLGAYGWYVDYKCPNCGYEGALFFDLH